LAARIGFRRAQPLSPGAAAIPGTCEWRRQRISPATRLCPARREGVDNAAATFALSNAGAGYGAIAGASKAVSAAQVVLEGFTAGGGGQQLARPSIPQPSIMGRIWCSKAKARDTAGRWTSLACRFAGRRRA
jgi:hypothetical protein